MKFQTNYAFIRTRKVPTGVSLTVPDQTMSMRMLMARHVRGLPLDPQNGYKEAIYDGDAEEFMIDPRRLDLAERQELAQKSKEELDFLTEKIRQDKKEFIKKRKDEYAKKEQEQRLRWKQEFEEFRKQKAKDTEPTQGEQEPS